MLSSLFQKFKDGLRRTTPTFQKFFGKLSGVWGKKLDDAALAELEEALYGADFGVETTEEILAEIKKAYRSNKELHGREAAAIGAAVLKRVLSGAEGRYVPAGIAGSPEVVALVGVNGAGKTTTAAKLAWKFGRENRRVILGACDTFRAAAGEQIQTWADRLGVELVPGAHGADAAAVAFDTLSAAKARGHDLVILDTAGRLHTKGHLLEELKKFTRVVQKHDERAPHHRWLVVDGSLGSNSIEQAKVFHEVFGLTGIIVTKLDGTSRGGAIVGIWRALKLPIYYVGLGEKPEDLQPFSVEDYAEAIFAAE